MKSRIASLARERAAATLGHRAARTAHVLATTGTTWD